MVDIDTLVKPNRVEAARFLGHASLGYTLAEVDWLVANGYKKWFDTQFAMNQNKFPTHHKWMRDKFPPLPRAPGEEADVGPGSRFEIDQLRCSIWRRFVEGDDLLRQKLTLTLSEIFVVSITTNFVDFTLHMGAAYLDILQRNALGNYRTLIGEVASSVAQSYFLTFSGSTKTDGVSHPDENFARELLQLFTLGTVMLEMNGEPKLDAVTQLPINTYSAAEIRALAKIFTGWETDRSGFNYSDLYSEYLPTATSAGYAIVDSYAKSVISNASNHDGSAINLLALNKVDQADIPAMGPGFTAVDRKNRALDIICAHPNVAPFISKQLIKKLVTSNPSPEYVRRIAEVFKSTNGDFYRVAQAILMDEELFEGGRRTGMGSGDRNTFGKLREPVTRIIHWARAFKVKSKTGYWVVKNMRAGSDTIDQQPMFAPGVFNFFRPGYTPSGLRTAALNLVAPEFQIASEVTVTNYINFLNQIVEYGIDHGGWSSYLWPADEVKPDYTAWIEKARNPSSLVAELSLLMSASQLHPDTLDIIADAVSKSAGRTRDELKARVMIAIVLVMASPEYLIQQ